jgi:HPt (histidine-containing phosphotransfer) domain-containing protein
MNSIASEQSLPPPLDPEHLSRHTLGDRALEREVLQLFCSQLALHLDDLSKAASLSEWRRAAHSLKGSAQAVGASRIAEAAARAEALCGMSLDGARSSCVQEIEASIVEAKAYIASLI